ncbi:hypothetical protein [Coleofasciculus sp. FACHB-1120]|uniref:hypothetical protein n=1 Tax=Coleofasciculus sp. FACHB-1120 TaxID=2692783 RepID=UPI0016859549|nr:hypothetical protein [Coleofasciculus sp. FACHB-1120]MBD2741575.1 hypothetical protein [Coleofasciculus sp. FACHB-1120]
MRSPIVPFIQPERYFLLVVEADSAIARRIVNSLGFVAKAIAQAVVKPLCTLCTKYFSVNDRASTPYPLY